MVGILTLNQEMMVRVHLSEFLIALWLGRQLADHLGSEPGMLWVRIPLELLCLWCRGWHTTL